MNPSRYGMVLTLACTLLLRCTDPPQSNLPLDVTISESLVVDSAPDDLGVNALDASVDVYRGLDRPFDRVPMVFTDVVTAERLSDRPVDISAMDVVPWPGTDGMGVCIGQATCVWRSDRSFCWGYLPVSGEDAGRRILSDIPQIIPGLDRISSSDGNGEGMLFSRGLLPGTGWDLFLEAPFGAREPGGVTRQYSVPWLAGARHLFRGYGGALFANELGELWGVGVLLSGTRDRSMTLGPTPQRLFNLSSVTRAAMSGGHACVVHENGRVSCWGDARFGQLQNVVCLEPESCFFSVPSVLPAVRDAVEVSTGYGFSCARLRDGRVQCWGRNGYFGNRDGVLGNGNDHLFWCRFREPHQWFQFECAESPVYVHSIRHAVRLVTTGDTSCAIEADGSLWCWGQIIRGAFGPETGPTLLSPMRVPGPTDVVDVALAGGDGCALERSGAVWCWGYVVPDAYRVPIDDAGTSSAITRIPMPPGW